MTDLIPVSGATIAINPATGEAIDLAAPTDQLAHAIDQVRDLEARLRAHREDLGAEVLRRMDHEGVWTRHVDPLPGSDVGYKVTGDTPAPKVEWDADRLAHLLDDAVTDGVISEAAARKAVSIRSEHVAHASGINALLKLGGQLAEQIQGCRREVAKRRRVAVTPRHKDLAA
jgi:hypothetical protein